ncbi:PREDICTED: uncharacterized protein LOC104601488 isoform X2 [Nelumbo nucifera]|uniref:Uncharacterized protein LOC104601488 isoform X2 n=1 Tax=Nelumbo nucifera TaxID=4432 RepID=A0A1U8A792_NELNU|nr:PREDICTED: uncharacterized protein LOC104601488 isoform X2 [Nelumbo nucifera]
MADPVSYGNPERDVEQALVALKKGTQLIKYGRKGKPKLCPFRVSIDETTLIWYSHGEERNLKLSSVSRIIPGQRTAVFRRYLRPDKDYLSFSLLYNNGERTLDLLRDGGDFIQNGRPSSATWEITSSFSRKAIDFYSREYSLSLRSSDVGSDRANMQLRTSAGDGFRLSVSSAAPSCSSQGSGLDDIESLGDVYVWGEVWSDGTSADGPVNPFPSKIDVLLPRSLESNVVLDVNQISCGVRHAALVTRHGEIFTWGEESGGRLGHGADKDYGCPQLVEFLAVHNVDNVACGEYHTCAVTTSGDLFTWGDGTHNAGLLGHGTDVSHWIPKRVSGPLEGLQVLSVACGTWHSALATSTGRLFTFGDGTFGVLGHGNRETIAYPREVQSLSGLKTIKVACGVWHTAAIVEVMGQPGANISSRKLFTWGDGGKYRLGHGDTEAKLDPTCVPALVDYNFHQLACGHNITVGLTTSGHVFTMGSTAYGQLGNPQSDGRIPCLVQDRLISEFVEEISCGSFHVAVLTSRSEVFTWGRGANGRLGHGDTEDRRAPTLVEALKDRHVRSISCGSNFTASICIHKWVSGADQSVCSGCRQAFGFTRKRHNCYNCGLVHCHACSSKKALRAALAPTPSKPHRVCDSCYAKLKASEVSVTTTFNRRSMAPRRSTDSRERLERGGIRSSRMLLSPGIDPMKYLDVRLAMQAMISDFPVSFRPSQAPAVLQLKDIAFQSSLTAPQCAKPVVMSVPQPVQTLRPSSPYSRKPSPTRMGTVFPNSTVESLIKRNELLNQDIMKLRSQVKNLKQKCEVQDMEVEKSQKNAQEAASLAAIESSKYKAVKDAMKSILIELKEMSEKLPAEVYDSTSIKAMHSQIEALLNTDGSQALEASSSPTNNLESEQQSMLDSTLMVDEPSTSMQDQRIDDAEGTLEDGNRPSVSDTNEVVPPQSMENGSRSSTLEVTEQFEPGVYVTFVPLKNGTKAFKRVRFSKRKFDSQQAEEWWKENKDRLLKKYKHPGTDGAPTGLPVGPTPVSEESETTTHTC